MKVTALGCVSAVAGIILLGCAPELIREEQMTRQNTYRRIAIVCAPAPATEPRYTKMILDNVKPRLASRLGFLDAVECLFDAPVSFPEGISYAPPRTPPTVSLGEKASAYDGIVCLVYWYDAGVVKLDMYVIEARTGQNIWFHQLATEDANVENRLRRHASWVPTMLKMRFYGRE
jgi:hypothetical protein